MSSLTGARTSSTATTPEAAEELVDVDGVSAVVSDVVVAASVVSVASVIATRAGATFVSLLDDDDDDDATEVPFGEFFAEACGPGEATARTRELLKPALPPSRC